MGRITVLLGKPKALLSSDKLGLAYFPDMPVVALSAPGFPVRLLIVAGVSTYLMEGADIEHLTRARKVLSPGKHGSYDNGYAGIAGVFRNEPGKIYALYHAEDQEGMAPIAGGIPGFYACVAAATSSDEGRTWQKLGPAITSSLPRTWAAYPEQADRGIGEPCLIANPSGKYLYAYYTDHTRSDSSGVQIGMARASLPVKTPGWNKYFNGRFTEPGIGGKNTPVISAHHLKEADAIMPYVTYSGTLQSYVMLFNVNCWRELAEPTRPAVSGIYVCYSKDGIQWSEPERLIADYAVARIGSSVAWHPSILWDKGSTRNGWLLYGYSEHWGHRADKSGVPHYLVGRRIAFRS